MLRTGIVVLALLGPVAARAAATDCIQEGGEMVCTEPIVKSEDVDLCYETASYLWMDNLATTCGWGSVGTSVGDVVSKVNCFENGITGCSGAATQFPGWSTAGQTYSSYWCWTVTTTARNGYLLNQFAPLTTSAVRKDSAGNCTSQGGFPIGVVAVIWRDVGCPAGWSTATRPNGDYRCYRCPDDSTWNGSSCACRTGYVKDPRTHLCIPACPNDDACDDGDYCNGTETCVAGLCQPGTKVSCDDGIQCTDDRCVAGLNQCVFTVDPLRCRCDVVEPPDVNINFERSASLVKIDCPVVGGDAGGSVKLSAKSTYKHPTCASGCEASFSGSGSVELNASLCSQTYKATAAGTFQRKETHCVECGSQCLETCGAGACVTSGLTGSASVEVERKINVKWLKWKRDYPGGVTMECGGTWGGSVATSLGYEGTENEGYCKACPDCSKLTSTLTGSANLKGSCAFKTKDSNPVSGCVACLDLKATLKGSSTGQWGACGTSSCPATALDVEGAGKMQVALKFGWWEVSGECASTVKACAEDNACGTCTCKGCRDVQWERYSCKVTSSNKQGAK